jgi:23S rRNA (cytidine1920-2'-O)/16S rRNA (cytidine1409-2'-O)-methyltransferase
MPRRAPFITLDKLLAHRHPDADLAAIPQGRVIVDGRPLTNPTALVRRDAAVRVLPDKRLRGDIKLSVALDTFSVDINGRAAADIGASAGGFTTALLRRGARRVYAIDAGIGQLVGRLRADRRVVNLEGHNLGAVRASEFSDTLDVITIDLSYLALARAIPQLEGLPIARDADLIALVKPTFELRRASLARAADDLDLAAARVIAAFADGAWEAVERCPAPVTGRRGAPELFIHARRNLRSRTPTMKQARPKEQT